MFVDAISSFLLEDKTSPGIIDENEANWLVEKLQGDGKLDDVELALLNNLKLNAKEMPQPLLNLL